MNLRFINCGAIKHLEKHLFWIATFLFYQQMYIKTKMGTVLWLASGKVLVYKYQGFEDDSLINRKPVKRL